MYKFFSKQVGQGLALVEFTPKNVKSPASAFPFSESSNISPSRGGGTQNQIPVHTQPQAVPSLILLSGSQVALKNDVSALDLFLRKKEKFSLQPSISVPMNPGTAPSSSCSTPSRKSKNIPKEGPSSDDVRADSYQNIPLESVSELQLRICPTIPMQTQALADFCIACLEKALTVYAMERILAACGNAMIPTTAPPLPQVPLSQGTVTESNSLSNSIPSPTLSRALKDPNVSGKSLTPVSSQNMLEIATTYDRVHESPKKSVQLTTDRKNGFGTPEKRPQQTALCGDFLRMHHSALCAAPTSSFFPHRSSGILHMPFLLPKQKAYAIRANIISRLSESFPALVNPSIDCHCDPLFLEKDPIGTESAPMVPSGDTPTWCDAPSSLSSSATQCNATLFGAPHLFPLLLSSLPTSCSLSLSSSSSATVSCVVSPLYRTPVDTVKAPIPDDTGVSVVGTAGGSAAAAAGISATINSISNTSTSNMNIQGDSRERNRANSSESRSRDRSSSFTPPLSSTLPNPFGSGEYRSLVDYDALIASTLPLWLRRRSCLLEISTSIDGLFIFFFNLSPQFANIVSDVCASAVADGVRMHNEQIRQQLIMLGILKERVDTPLQITMSSQPSRSDVNLFLLSPAPSTSTPLSPNKPSAPNTAPFPQNSVALTPASSSTNLTLNGTIPNTANLLTKESGTDELLSNLQMSYFCACVFVCECELVCMRVYVCV